MAGYSTLDHQCAARVVDVVSDEGDFVRTCRTCGEVFILTASERDWLTARFGRDYRPPTNCGTCRSARKTQERPYEDA